MDTTNNYVLFAVSRAVELHVARIRAGMPNPSDADVWHTASYLHSQITGVPAPEGEYVPHWATRLIKLSHQIISRQETGMALTEDLAQAIADLQAEDGIVIKALDDLLAQANAKGSVSDTDVQAAVDAVKTEIANAAAAVQADDPGVVPPPTPAPGA